MSHQSKTDLEQAAEIVGTLKQFVKVLEDRSAEMLNAQKLDQAQARNEGVKLKLQLAEIAHEAVGIREELTHFLQNEMRRVLADQVHVAATGAGQAQAKAFGDQVAQQITEGTTTSLAIGAAKASAAATLLQEVGTQLTRKRLLFTALASAGLGLGMVLAVLALLEWYVPSRAEMESLRAERTQLQASIEELTQRGGRIKLNQCGDDKRLCVLIDRAAEKFGDGKKGEVYMIPKGY